MTPNTEVGNAWAKREGFQEGPICEANGRLEGQPVFRNNYVDKRKAKKKSPRSEITKRRISESLSGQKIGGNEFQINSTDGEQLRAAARRGDNFKHQDLIDWWRNLSSS